MPCGGVGIVANNDDGCPLAFAVKKQPHFAKELCLFLKHQSWKKKLMTLVVILSIAPYTTINHL